MWSAQRSLLDAHPRIRCFLAYRYLNATWLSYLLEYEVLAMALLYLRFNPLEMLDWILFSFHTLMYMFVMVIMVAGYGLILCCMQQQLPLRHIANLRQELTLKTSLLALLLSYGYFSSWLYMSYIEKLNFDMDVSFTQHYLLMNGAFCGLAHFVGEHLCFGGETLQPPLRELYFEGILLHWRHLTFGLGKSCLLTVSFACLCFPNMSGDYYASWRLICLAGCHNTLITAKMHSIADLYAFIMQRKLPLSLRARSDDKLPLILSLRVNCLPGFQLMAARDFYEDTHCSSSDLCTKLFQLQGRIRKEPYYWQMLREVLLDRIQLFTERLQQCQQPRAASAPPRCDPTVSYAGMRPLCIAPKASRVWSRRYGDKQPPCQKLRPPHPLNPCPILSRLRQRFQNFYQQEVLWIQQYLEPDPLEYELCCGRPISWLLQGLVCICVRSLEEDRFGILQDDLGTIFILLLNLNKLICLLKQHLLDQGKTPCENLEKLVKSSTCSLNILVLSFNSYLDYIVEDKELLRELQSRSR